MLPNMQMYLSDFEISPRNGFLPDNLPLQRLPGTYYEPWEWIVHNLPILLKTHRLRAEVDKLPILSVSKLESEREWQRAYVLLAFLTHGYIWGGERPSETLPPAITVPFIPVAAHFDLPMTATYAALNLWNYTCTTDAGDLTNPDNLRSLHTFTGTEDEGWFYAISISTEARGGPIISTMLRALSAVCNDDVSIVCTCLRELTDCLRDLGKLLERMYEKCDPLVFYHEIRPKLAGSKNMGIAGLPRGVFYDEGNGRGAWRQYSGGSNAQSSLIQFFDAVLGVEHHATGEPIAIAKKNSFIQDMRRYMPGPHARFLDQFPRTILRNYVLSYPTTHQINEDYNAAVAMLSSFRDIHIQMVTRYIILPSKSPRSSLQNKSDASQNMDLATASSRRRASQSLALHGTGGTDLIPFLKQTRDETKGAAVFAE